MSWLGPLTRLLLVATVAALPLRPCCCGGPAEAAAADFVAAPAKNDQSSSKHGCCRTEGVQPDEPIPATPSPAPCSGCDACSLTVPHEASSGTIAMIDGGYAPATALPPTPVAFAPAAERSALRWPTPARPDHFHGDSLRALSCLLTI